MNQVYEFLCQPSLNGWNKIDWVMGTMVLDSFVVRATLTLNFWVVNENDGESIRNRLLGFPKQFFGLVGIILSLEILFLN